MQGLESIASNRWIGYGLLAAAVTVLAVLTAVQPLVAIGTVALVAALLVAAYFASRPWQILALFVFLLPPHVVLMTLLLVQVGLPSRAVKAISAWKEGALLLLLVLAGWRALRARWTLKVPDLLVLLYVVLVAVSLVSSILSGVGSRAAIAYGARDALLPVVLYMVGRCFPMTESRARCVFRWLIWAALIFSVIGIIERLFIPTEWHVLFGIPQYFQELLGLYYPPHLEGLPENYWTSSNSGRLRRAVSIYGSSQPFALSFLLLLPVTFYGAVNRALPERRLAQVALLVSLIALFLTITRFTIVACLLLLVLGALLHNRQARRWAAVVMVVVGILFGLAVLTSSSVQLLVFNTLTFQDTSSSLRLNIWRETAEVITQQPLGYGIGSVGQTANRFLAGGNVVAIEGQYSKIAVEFGIPGLLVYGSTLVVISLSLLVAAQRIGTPYLRGLCFATGLTVVGLSLNALPTEWHNSPPLVYPTWWLVGACLASTPRRSAGAGLTEATRNGSALSAPTEPA